MNVRGLGDRKKRKATFRFLKDTKADAIFLQETHLDSDKQQLLWEQEWGNKIISSKGKSNSAGVCILLNTKNEFQILETKVDTAGRIVCCTARYADKKIFLCNLYAPNNDDPQFFENLIGMVDQHSDSDVTCVGGDFNLVMSPDIDRVNSTQNHKNAANIFKEYMNKVNLCDIWRILNPEIKRYTWHRWSQHAPASSRIDMLMIHQNLTDLVLECNISTGFRTDHSLVDLTIKIDNFQRGPGVWKLNNNHLDDERYVEGIKQVLDNVSYEAPLLNPSELWEFAKQECITFSKVFSKTKGKMRSNRLKELIRIKNVLEEDLDRTGEMSELMANYTKVKTDIQKLADADAEGAMFRTKSQYFLSGEKCTKYFFGLEKKRYLEKNMKCVELDDGTIITNQPGILREQTDFYKRLYSKDHDVHFALQPDTNERQISDLEKSKCDQDISEGELFDAIMTLKSKKVPGLDGLTIEFYRKFYKNLKDMLLGMYRHSFEMGLLPDSLRKGLISLIPKKLKNTKRVKNMRPLTILANDYKILAKLIDNRLREVIPNLINSDQTGFVKGRNIVHNIRRSLDLIEITKLKKIPAVILTIDMEKCFDRLEHSAIYGSLRYFNFGDTFIRWTSLFYTNFQFCTQNFGYLSEFCNKERGCNQGCPLSPGIYLLTAEILANKIRNDPKIKGIHVNNIEYIISQFADDTDLYLNYDYDTINTTLSTLTKIEKNTGLKVSYDKTVIYRIGSLSNTSAKMYTNKSVRWSNEYINTLGVNISNNAIDIEHNWNSVVQKLKVIANMWYFRSITLSGKVLVVNQLIASLFVYKMQVIYPMNDKLHKDIDAVIVNYLWKGKKPKISLTTLQRSKKEGGLGLVNLKQRHKALLFNWIAACINNENMFNLASYFIGKTIDPSLIWELNLTKKDSVKTFPGVSFWHSLIHEWHGYSYHEPQNQHKILNQIIWYNSIIRCNDKPFVLKTWIKGGIIRFKDLLDEYYELISLEKLQSITNGAANWLQYQSLRKAIPQHWFRWVKSATLLDSHVNKIDVFNKKSGTVSSRIYCDLLTTDELARKCSCIWFEKTGIASTVTEFLKYFRNIAKITNITKYRDFQFRLIHNKIFCNDVLLHYGIVESNTCNLCQNGKQTITHLLWGCAKFQNLFQYLLQVAKDAEIHVEYDVLKIICNDIHPISGHVINFLLLILKQFIFRCKCQYKEPTVIEYQEEIKMLHNIEKLNAQRTNRMGHHKRKWSPVYEILLL